jgi:hypothetical protein
MEAKREARRKKTRGPAVTRKQVEEAIAALPPAERTTLLKDDQNFCQFQKSCRDQDSCRFRHVATDAQQTTATLIARYNAANRNAQPFAAPARRPEVPKNVLPPNATFAQVLTNGVPHREEKEKPTTATLPCSQAEYNEREQQFNQRLHSVFDAGASAAELEFVCRLIKSAKSFIINAEKSLHEAQTLVENFYSRMITLRAQKKPACVCGSPLCVQFFNDVKERDAHERDSHPDEYEALRNKRGLGLCCLPNLGKTCYLTASVAMVGAIRKCNAIPPNLNFSQSSLLTEAIERPSTVAAEAILERLKMKSDEPGDPVQTLDRLLNIDCVWKSTVDITVTSNCCDNAATKTDTPIMYHRTKLELALTPTDVAEAVIACSNEEKVCPSCGSPCEIKKLPDQSFLIETPKGLKHFSYVTIHDIKYRPIAAIVETQPNHCAFAFVPDLQLPTPEWLLMDNQCIRAIGRPPVGPTVVLALYKRVADESEDDDVRTSVPPRQNRIRKLYSGLEPMEPNQTPAPAPAPAAPPAPVPEPRSPTPPPMIKIAVTNWQCGCPPAATALNLQILADRDVIVITEPGIASTQTLQLLKAKHDVFHAQRLVAGVPSHRGGVMVLAKRYLAATAEAIPPAPDGVEATAVTLHTLSGHYTIVGSYFPPGLPPPENAAMSWAVSTREALGDNAIIAGDFNAHHPAWGELEENSIPSPATLRGTSLFDAIAENGSCVVIGAPTRGDHNLDIALIPSSMSHTSPSIRTQSASDHAALILTVGSDETHENTMAPSHYVIGSALPRHFTADHQCLIVAALNRDLVVTGGSISAREHHLRTAMLAAMKLIPGGDVRKRPKKSPSLPNLQEITAAANKSVFAAIQLLSPRKEQLPPEISAEELANKFAELQRRPTEAPLPSLACENFNEISEEEISEAILSFKASGGQDPDGITPGFLIVAAQSQPFLSALAALANKCVRNGRIPQHWKESCVVPIQKPGQPATADTLRGIFNTSLLCRTVDRCLDDRLKATWTPHPCQLGFRKGVALDAIPANILASMDRGISRELTNAKMRTLILAIDLKNAFPSVIARDVIDELQRVGAPPEVLSFRSAMLDENRRLRVVIDADRTSSWQEYDNGSSQGSVSGPSDFSLASTSLAEALKSWCEKQILLSDKGFGLGADDLTIWLTGTSNNIIVTRYWYL